MCEMVGLRVWSLPDQPMIKTLLPRSSACNPAPSSVMVRTPVPSEIIDRIGGWTSEGVGQGYGFGYPLNVLQDWIKRLEI